MRSNQLHIASPCHESWDAMRGEGATRFCGVCQKDVHDLSAMAQDEANALLAEQAEQSLCVRYTSESDGTLRFRDLVPLASLTRKIVRTAFAAVALAACTPHGDAPVQGLGDQIIESIRAATVPTADGGCDYTTGPFTTFHFPAGHTLCQQTGAQGFEVPMPPPVPEVEAMGALAPPEQIEPPPQPVVIDPIPPPRMGQAIVAPEKTDPFVPCDPEVKKKPPPRDTSMMKKGALRRAPPREMVKDAERREKTMGVLEMAD